MDYQVRKVMFSSKHGYHRTPLDLFNQLDAEFDFTTDVCADPFTSLKPGIYNLRVHSLTNSWRIFSTRNVCWMNCPYQRGVIKQWLAKASHEANINGVMTVALLPCRTSEKWFWDYCIDREIRLIKGRVRFSNMKTGAPFPSCIVIFKGNGLSSVQ